MKSLARMYVYWPNMNEDIERLVKECTQCQENQSEAQQVPGNGHQDGVVSGHILIVLLYSVVHLLNFSVHVIVIIILVL